MWNRATLLSVLLVLVPAFTLLAMQKRGLWTAWTEQEAAKILNDSGWSQTLTEIEPTVLRLVKNDVRMNLRVRFLSAKPIRQALFRFSELNPEKILPTTIEDARRLLDSEFDQSIVVAVTYDGGSGCLITPVAYALRSGNSDSMKKSAYLEVDGGKRVYAQSFQPLGVQLFGARFTFPRDLAGRPIIDPEANTITFYAQFPTVDLSVSRVCLQYSQYKSGEDRTLLERLHNLTINMRFKVAKFMYEGVLEY